MPLLRLLGNLLFHAPRWLFVRLFRSLGRDREGWVILELADGVDPAPIRRSRLQALLHRGSRRVTGDGLLRLSAALKRDASTVGLLVRMPRFRAGWAWAGGVRRLLSDLVDAGKRVVVYLPEGATDRELYIASAASTIVVTPRASVSLLGFAAGGMYLRGLLDRIGLQAQVSAEGDYKTAAERLVDTNMSGQEREQLAALLQHRQGLLADALGARSASRGRVDDLFERAALSVEEAISEGLVDVASYEDGLPRVLGIDPADRRARPVGARIYVRRAELAPFRPLRRLPYIAIVPISGVIQRGPGWDRSGALRQITPLEATQFTLRRLRRDERAVAIMLYVDSPGGSALVSDLIHREVQNLAGAKPVVAFFANVAASGGYYVATPAREIIAAPESITGSIGVVAVKLVAQQLLGKLQVHSEVVKSAPHADMLSPARGYSEREQQLMAAETRRVYEGFLQVVAEGRRRSREEVAAVARGRVWHAEDALRHGLVDALGDMDLALARLRELSDVPQRYRSKLRAKLCPPLEKREPAQPPSGDTSAWLASRLGATFPELALWDLATSGRERVLCCSLAALRVMR